MTVKLIGTIHGPTYMSDDSPPSLIADLSARLFKTHSLLHDLVTQINKVKDDTDAALLMLEGRVHELEDWQKLMSTPASEPPSTSAKRSAKS